MVCKKKNGNYRIRILGETLNGLASKQWNQRYLFKSQGVSLPPWRTWWVHLGRLTIGSLSHASPHFSEGRLVARTFPPNPTISSNLLGSVLRISDQGLYEYLHRPCIRQLLSGGRNYRGFVSSAVQPVCLLSDRSPLFCHYNTRNPCWSASCKTLAVR